MSRYSYSRYLSSKKTVDDRALNRYVTDQLRNALTAGGIHAPRVLEIGAGLGTMVARMIDWKLLERAEYVLLDADETCVSDARGWLTTWARAAGHEVSSTPRGLRIQTAAGADVSVSMVHAELEQFLSSPRAMQDKADVLIANAFLDLVDVPYFLPRLFDLLVPRGTFWFTINFDGETIFLPEHPADAKLMAVYHRSMDERVRYGRRAGDSRSGRHLLEHLRRAGANILGAGASDWFVFSSDGRYQGDEAYFLTSIIETIDAELSGWREVDQAELRSWVDLRKTQVQRGELSYLAHQLDFVGSTAPAS